MSRTTLISRWIAVTSTAAVVASCDFRNDPGVAEKIALLEAELRERSEQLSAMQEELESASESDTESTGAPDLETAKGTYLGFVEGLRAKLSEAMPDTKFDRTSVFPVEGPDPSRPIVSRVGFRIVGPDGRSGEMLIPLAADSAGDWQEPETTEILASFKAGLAAPPVAATQPAPAPATPAKPARPQLNDVMGANRTIEVQWNDPPAPAPVAPAQAAGGAPAAPPQAPQPPATPALPKKVMPTSRDVIIDFE